MGGIDVATMTFTVMGVSFGWGAVVAAIINFLVVALALFVLVRLLSKLDKEPDPTTRECPYCTTEIAKVATRCPACTSEVSAQA
jgi:large conductance mechanosensitive channel